METTLDVDFYEESQFLHDIDRWQELMPVEYPASIHDARKVGVASFQFATALNVISLLNRTARLVIASTCFAAVDHGNHECRCPSSRLWWPIGVERSGLSDLVGCRHGICGTHLFLPLKWRPLT